MMSEWDKDCLSPFNAIHIKCLCPFESLRKFCKYHTWSFKIFYHLNAGLSSKFIPSPDCGSMGGTRPIPSVDVGAVLENQVPQAKNLPFFPKLNITTYSAMLRRATLTPTILEPRSSGAYSIPIRSARYFYCVYQLLHVLYRCCRILIVPVLIVFDMEYICSN